jgi:hypothetical protein
MRLQLYYHFASTLLLLVGVVPLHKSFMVHGQFIPGCDYVLWSAGHVSNNSCGCRALPKCSKCQTYDPHVYVASCINGCEYCDAATGTNCGTLQKQDRWGTYTMYILGFWYTSTLYDMEYTWTYTRGKSGSIVYRFRSDDYRGTHTCNVTVNGQSCASCQYLKCNNTDTLTNREPTIDCTNLQAGATATACSGRTAGGPISLDESAMTGILAPLAYPYLLCQRGAAVLGTGSITPPPSAAGPAPVSAPTTPNASNNKDCGLFKLNMFCLNGCGMFGRILGLCRNE